MKKLLFLFLCLVSLTVSAQHGNFTDLRLIHGDSVLSGTSNGTVYYDQALHLFRFRQNGAWTTLGPGTSGLTQGTNTLTSDLTFTGSHNLYISLTGSFQSQVTSLHQIGSLYDQVLLGDAAVGSTTRGFGVKTGSGSSTERLSITEAGLWIVNYGSDARGGIPVRNSSGNEVRLPIGAANTYLSGGTDPTYAQVSLSAGVTGDLPFANLTQISGRSVLGVPNSSTADVAAITASADAQFLSRHSGTVGFAAIVAADLPNTTVTPASYTNTNLTVDAQGRITAASNGSSGSASALVPTAVKTANYTAAVNDLVPCDITTTGSFTVTLPTTPADGSVIAVKIVKFTATRTITLAAGGSDVFNVASGSTSLSLSRLFQTVTLQYKSSSAIWYVTSTDPAPATATTGTSDTAPATNAFVQQEIAANTATLPLSLANGGTAANLTASNGGIFYSTGSAGAILSGTATANKPLVSGSSTTPAWAGYTIPSTLTTGDLPYASSSSVLNKLAIGSTGDVLTVSGGVPSWSAPAGGTVASLAEALAGTNNTKIITPLRNASVNARVYNVEAYGAMHDYQTVANASITSGTAALTTGSAAFAASDVGKTIRLFGAGAAGVDLVTTITVFTSSTAVTINTNASTTIASKQIEWGTDDTPFIQLAINACHTAGGGKVYFPNGTYLLAGALVTSLDSVNPNCQLYIPLTQTSETKLTIELVGESSIPFPSGPTAAQNLPTKGAILKSIIIGSGATPSVIGSSFFNDGFTNGNLSICVVRDLSVIVKSMQGTTHIAPKMSAFHMSYFSAKRMYDCMAMTESDPTESIVPSDVTYGFLLSVGSHTDIHSSYQNLTASGYYYAFYVEEHDSWTRLNAYNCLNALGIGGSVDNHPIFSMGSITAHWCKYGIVFLSGKTVNIDYYAERWPGALTSHWYDGTADIYIPSTVAISGFIRGRAATAGTGAVVPLSISGTYTGSLNIFDYYTASYNNTFKIVSSSVGTNLSITGAQGSGGVDSYMTNLTSSGFVRSIWENNRGSFASFAAIAHVGSTASGFNTIFGISSAVDWTFFYQNGASAAGMAIGTVGSAPLLLGTNNVERARFISGGQFGLGVTAPTATIHPKASSTAASSAPLKFNSGTLMTTAEAGAFEFLTDKIYFSITTGAARKELALVDAALTSGRVPFVTTNGRLLDDASLTYAVASGLNISGAYTTTSAAGATIGTSFTNSTNSATFRAAEITSTINQTSSGTGNVAMLNIIPTLTSVLGTTTGIDYNPTIISVGTHYGILIRPAGTLNGFGVGSAPTAMLHIGVGSATRPQFKFEPTTTLTTAQSGVMEFNTSWYQTNSIGLRYGLGGVIFDTYSDAQNSGTSETDLFTYTTPASTLNSASDKITAKYSGTFNDLTATGQLKVYFGGTLIGDTGALTVSSTGGWEVNVYIIRVDATTARASVTINTPGASTASYTKYTEITGLTFTNTNILKLTGTAGGASGGSSDITGKLSFGNWFAKANN